MLVIVEQSHDPPVDCEIMARKAQDLFPCIRARNVQWLRTLVSSDGRRTLCELEGPDVDSVREAYRSAGFAPERVWAARILSPDSPGF